MWYVGEGFPFPETNWENAFLPVFFHSINSVFKQKHQERTYLSLIQFKGTASQIGISAKNNSSRSRRIDGHLIQVPQGQIERVLVWTVSWAVAWWGVDWRGTECRQLTHICHTDRGEAISPGTAERPHQMMRCSLALALSLCT